MTELPEESIKTVPEFSGNIFIFHAFDVGEDINLAAIKKSGKLLFQPTLVPKYFKNYHTPLTVELPHPQHTNRCIGANLYHFGAIGLMYQIPFTETLETLRQDLNAINNTFQEQSVSDAHNLFNKIKSSIYQPNFFQHRTSYLIIQVDPKSGIIDIDQLKQRYGSIIASMLRFEAEQLSEHQKNEILAENIGYYRGDLVIIDTECAFVYDSDYHELLDFFEFANIQQLELQYFDKVLDQQLNAFYERKKPSIPFSAYIPFIGTKIDPVSELDRLKVDISVITERLKNSIKLSGEAYYSELYEYLERKLDLINWKESIDEKLAIIRDIKTVYNDKVNMAREDILEVLIIILIFIELMVGIFK